MSSLQQDRTSQSQANVNKDRLKDKPEANTSGNNHSNERSTEWGNTNDPNFNPDRQSSGIDAGKPSNPNTPTPRNMDQDEGNLHPVVADDDRVKASGRRIHGGPNEPLVTLNPTGAPVGSQGKQKTEQVSDALNLINDTSVAGSLYEGIDDIEAEQGFLIPISPGETIDQTVLKAQKEAKRLNDYYSIDEVNEKGERLLDTVIVEEFKRNDDGSIQLGVKGKPIVSANQTHIPRRIQLRQYVAKSVVKGDKISQDGALIVRVF